MDRRDAQVEPGVQGLIPPSPACGRGERRASGPGEGVHKFRHAGTPSSAALARESPLPQAGEGANSTTHPPSPRQSHHNPTDTRDTDRADPPSARSDRPPAAPRAARALRRATTAPPANHRARSPDAPPAGSAPSNVSTCDDFATPVHRAAPAALQPRWSRSGEVTTSSPSPGTSSASASHAASASGSSAPIATIAASAPATRRLSANSRRRSSPPASRRRVRTGCTRLRVVSRR